MTYVPAEYWTHRGRSYEAEAIEKGWVAVENAPLFDLLDTLTFDSVLEVGCGFGRVGAAILRHYPGVTYTGIDVSPDLIEAARKRLPNAEFIVADLEAWWATDRRWDLVLSVSVLGHIRPQYIEWVIGQLRKAANNDVVAIDWNEVGKETTFQYGHDYGHLYGDAALSVTPYGRQDIWHVRPQNGRPHDGQ
ncbi:MAG TPA: class I SAM-dependent methyltransferase [Pseudonocardiaceae bacterium]|nr:class I SAM-dependent methyltransferase [Pseudonocardiaceae bacterium]